MYFAFSVFIEFSMSYVSWKIYVKHIPTVTIKTILHWTLFEHSMNVIK